MAVPENAPKEYEDHAMAVIDIFKKYGITVTEDLCRTVFTHTTAIFMSGYKTGTDSVLDHIERALSARMGGQSRRHKNENA